MPSKQDADKKKNDAVETRKMRKERLIKQGILKPELVFGNVLSNVPKYSSSDIAKEKELPEFLVRIIKKIELKIDTVGLYRVNGHAAEVQQIR